MSGLDTPLDLSAAFRGRELLITGATGFLGKVALVMLLERYPELGRVHVLVRPRSGGSAVGRFFDKVAASAPFRPLRERYGDRFDAFLREKCSPLAGDVAAPLLGLDAGTVDSLRGRLACVINSAGLVTFDPALDQALAVNTLGAQHAAALCLATGAALVHISTCFVAGARSGPVFEDEPIAGSFPKQQQRGAARAGESLSVARELADAQAQVQRLRQGAEDAALTARLRAEAIARLEAEGRDPGDERALRMGVSRERRIWLARQLTEAGMARAQQWGWPNTYTYSKALGEQAIAASGCRYSLVRPSIVESALSFPFPGWNEGFTTTAPLVFLALNGQRAQPAGERTILDVIPVDMVAAGVIAVAGAACADRARAVYHLASGDVNPLTVRRAIELSALFKRGEARRPGVKRTSLLRRWREAWLEPFAASPARYRATSAPLQRRLASTARGLLERGARGGLWGMPAASALAARGAQRLELEEAKLQAIESTLALFLPFVAGERITFQCANIRALWSALGADDRARLRWAPEQLDWRRYGLDIHMKGLARWVFPALEEQRDQLRREVPLRRDLLELLAAAIAAFGPRTALRTFAGADGQRALSRTRDDRVTYAELGRFSERAARHLLARGVRAGEPILLMSESRAEWSMACFGVLKAGCAVAPLDDALTAAEVAACAAATGARLLLASPQALEQLGAIPPGLTAIPLPELLRAPEREDASAPAPGAGAAPEAPAVLLLEAAPDRSWRGSPLTHRELAERAAALGSRLDLRIGEGLLSVLPLHQPFELVCGLLAPLSLGAEITYLDQPTAARLGEALESGHAHALLGEPMLWQLLHRRLTRELAAGPRFVEAAVRAAMALHGELRDRTALNVGKLLFWPLHRRFAGKLRLLVTAGHELPAEVREAFHQLGFELRDGDAR